MGQKTILSIVSKTISPSNPGKNTCIPVNLFILIWKDENQFIDINDEDINMVAPVFMSLDSAIKRKTRIYSAAIC